MNILRGLLALIITLTITTSLNAQYLYQDEVIKNPDFTNEINKLGTELFEKTGIHLYLITKRTLENNQSISNYEKEILDELKEPAILLTFIELDTKVDVIARPTSLYEDFDKRQVLSPYISLASKIMTAVLFARSFDDVKEILSTPNGVMLPILGERAKGKDIVSKYAVATYQGYSDIAEQIAEKRGVVLDNAPGHTNSTMITLLKYLFYAMIVYGLYRYAMIIIRKKGEKKDD